MGGLNFISRDMHVMLFLLCSNFQHQANYAHCFIPIMLIIYNSALQFIRKLALYNIIALFLLLTFLCSGQTVTRCNYTRLYCSLNVHHILGQSLDSYLVF